MKYVGGTQGKANPKLTPIQVGFVQETPSANPSAALDQNGDIAAVDLINNELGGIDGHAVHFVNCPSVVTDEDGLQCAQKLANNAAIKVVVAGLLGLGSTPFWATLTQKPVVGFQPVNQGGTAPNSFMLGSGVFAFSGIATFIADDLHATTEVNVAPDLPIVRSIFDGFSQSLVSQGVQSTTAYYPMSAGDMSATLAASNITSAQAAFLATDSDATCIAVDQAILSFHLNHLTTIADPSCIDAGVKQALGDYPKWTYWSVEPNVYTAATAQLQEFHSAMAAYGEKHAIDGPAWRGLLVRR